MKIKIEGFVLSIIAVIGIAYFFPGMGNTRKLKFPIDAISAMGIFLIFFFFTNGLNWSLLK